MAAFLDTVYGADLSSCRTASAVVRFLRQAVYVAGTVAGSRS